MLTEVGSDAWFPASGQFRSEGYNLGASASQTLGYPRQGDGWAQLSHDFEVLGSVHVSIVKSIAVHTPPLSERAGENPEDDSAHVTGLRRRKPTVGLDYNRPCQGSFVVNLTEKFPHRGVHDGFTQPETLCHSLDIQVFYSDPPESLYNTSSQFMRDGLPDVGDSLVQAGQFRCCPLPVLSALCSTRKLLVQLPELVFVFAQNTWGLDLLSGGENGEVADPYINPHRGLSFTAMGVNEGVGDLDLNTEVPMARAFGEPGGEYFARKSKLLPSTNPPEFGDFDFPAIELESSPFDSEALLTSAPLLELRVTWLVACFYSAEKVREGIAEVLQGVVRDRPRDFLHPYQVIGFARVDLGVDRPPVRLLAGFVQFLPASKTKVVSKSSSPGAAIEERCLDIVRVKADTLSQNHDFDCSMNKSTACRTMAATVVSCRSASTRSQASMSGENCISWRTSLTRFRRFGMGRTVQHGVYPVKGQPRRIRTSSLHDIEIVGELEVRGEF